MTRKHYEAIAALLKYRRQQAIDYDSEEELCAIDAVTKDLAHYFKSDNSRFNPDRFYAAVTQ